MKRTKLLFGAILIFIIMSAFVIPIINGVPDALPKIPDGFYPWTKVKQMLISRITDVPNHLYEFNGSRTDVDAEDGDKFFKDLVISYGMLNTSWLKADSMPTAEIWVVALSDKLRQVMYDWCKPDYLAEFSKLSPYHQDVYIEIFEHAQKYLKTFSYEKELKYLERVRLKNSRDTSMTEAIKACPEYYRDHGFTYQGPDGNTKFRKLECFIFRRVHKNGIMPSDMLKLVNQITADLKAVRIATPDVKPTIIKLLPDSLVKNIPISPISEAVICDWELLDRYHLGYFNWGDSALNVNQNFFEFKRDQNGDLYYLVRSGNKLTFSEDDLYLNVVKVINSEYKSIEQKGWDGKPFSRDLWVPTSSYEKSFDQKINRDSLNIVMAESIKILQKNSELR